MGEGETTLSTGVALGSNDYHPSVISWEQKRSSESRQILVDPSGRAGNTKHTDKSDKVPRPQTA